MKCHSIFANLSLKIALKDCVCDTKALAAICRISCSIHNTFFLLYLTIKFQNLIFKYQCFIWFKNFLVFGTPFICSNFKFFSYFDVFLELIIFSRHRWGMSTFVVSCKDVTLFLTPYRNSASTKVMSNTKYFTQCSSINLH